MPNYFLWLLILGGGLFGGLLFAFQSSLSKKKENNQSVPLNEKKVIIDKDVFRHCLFGLAGGIIIFIILPCVPDVNSNSSSGWESLKILGLAIIGGYGGRVLVNKFAIEQIAELKTELYETTKRSEETKIELDQLHLEVTRSQAFILIDQWLHSSGEIDLEMTRSILRGVDSETRMSLFGMIDGRRRDLIHILLRGKDEHERKSQRGLFKRFIHIMEFLIELEKHNERISELYATLAYLYKDSRSPKSDDFKDCIEKAYKYITKAIDKSNNESYGLAYRKNRIIMAIPIGETSSQIFREDFSQVWEDRYQQLDLMTISNILAPGLHEWLIKNREEEIKEWLKLQKENERERWISQFDKNYQDVLR